MRCRPVLLCLRTFFWQSTCREPHPERTGFCASNPPWPGKRKRRPYPPPNVILLLCLRLESSKGIPTIPSAFTQGLIFANGFLYESTGLNGKSSLRQVELETGRVLKKYDLPFQYFGEGLTLWHGSLIQLTWTSGKGFVCQRPRSFAAEREFSYSGEGWGLTNDGKSLIMSNGTEELIFLNPATLVRQRSLRVLDNGEPVRLLNELEYIKGEIFANIWQEDFVVIYIPQQTGEVTGWIDMSALRGELPPASNAEALNGIAFHAEKDRIFVTGKVWPLLFEIEVIKQ